MSRRGGQEFGESLHHAVVDDECAAVLRAGMHGFERHRIHANAAGADLADGFGVIRTRSKRPRPSTFSEGISRIWYFSDVEPRFGISRFI